MEQIYLDMWELAKPHYIKGRPSDIEHIEWHMKHADRIAYAEGLEKRLLMPICILHDVGYSRVGEIKNCKEVNTKILHMQEGAKIADEILTQLNYPTDLKNRIVHYISVHDNWVINDNTPFHECKEMGVFNDLDFLWIFENYDLFTKISQAMDMNPERAYTYWTEEDEKHLNRPLCCDSTRQLYQELKERLKEKIF